MAVNNNNNNNSTNLRRPYISILVVVVVFQSLWCSTRSMSESEALVKLKRSFRVTNALDSWVPGSPPCNGTVQWRGILCVNGVVTGLSLQGLGLSGTVDVVALHGIRGLRIVSLANNSFSGPIPELGSLVALRAIYLSDNDFSGEIAANYFSRMTFLKKLWLSNNNFGGNVPSSLSHLPRLVEVHLENNRFGGKIPPFYAATASGSLVNLDLSGNRFVGDVPESLSSRFGPAAFVRNSGLCGASLGRDCHANGAAESKKVVAAAITSGAVIVTVAVLLIVRSKRRGADGSTSCRASSVEVHVSSLNKKEIESVKRTGSINSMARKGGGSSSLGGSGGSSSSSSSGSGGGAAVAADIVMVNELEKGAFGMPDLMKASAEVLGGSGMGSSYKAVMANGVAVVVKRIKDMNVGGKDRFDAEIRRLGKLTHRNVLSPLAYHFRKEEKLVVSEYVPGGSLLYLLHGDRGSSRSELNWAARLKIAHGIAKGLAYIHAELSSLELPHGNLKSSNILLGPDYDPLLSDYGFAHLINPAALSNSMFACRAPGSAISPKSDIYCLGVVLLEIMTGRFPSQYLGGTGKLGGTDVVKLAASSAGDEAALLDPEIANVRGSLGQMRRLVRLGAACADPDPGSRPTAAEALGMIEEIAAEDGGGRMQGQASVRKGYADSVPVFDGEDERRLKSGKSFAF